jgi:glycogen(starch) synthase
MKVLLLPASYCPVVGGLQTVVRTLAQTLKARGHDVLLITNKYPRTLPAREISDKVSIFRWHFLTPRLTQLINSRFDLFLAGVLYFPLTLARLVFLLRHERPDAVSLHFVGEPALFVLLARRFASFRLVVSLHGDDVEGLIRRRNFDRWLFRALLRDADMVTACSQYLLDRAFEIEPAASKKGRVIYNGMDQTKVASATSNTGSAVAVGRMVPKKGFNVLLRALASSKHQLRLTLIGDGPEREKLEELAQTLGLNGGVRFSGARDRGQILEEMAAAEVVVIPSLQEPFGLVALEAMAAGKPVVASDVGGLPEVLEGADAFLVPPGEPTELAAAIETVLQRLRRDPEFGARNRVLAARFSAKRMTEGYLEAYQA